MDILSVTQTTEAYNFHSHTQFCDGRDCMENFVKAAIETGITHYGFSPHSPIPLQSPCNMQLSDVRPYLDEVIRLRDVYGNRIHLYAAMEVDYLGPQWGPATPYFATLGLDYKIGSVHFIPNQQGEYVDIDGHFESFKNKMQQYFNNDIKYVVDTFYAQSRAMIEAGGFDILGHFDKIGHNASHFSPGIEQEKWYEQHVHDLIDLIASKDIIAELNTKAWEQHHRMFPNTRYLSLIKSKGIPMIVNSDAHYPALISASRAEGLLQLADN